MSMTKQMQLIEDSLATSSILGMQKMYVAQPAVYVTEKYQPTGCKDTSNESIPMRAHSNSTCDCNPEVGKDKRSRSSNDTRIYSHGHQRVTGDFAGIITQCCTCMSSIQCLKLSL